MAHDKTLKDLFHETLKDIYYAEQQIAKTLPKMSKAASSSELGADFQIHKKETEGQIARLERIFELIGEKPKGKRCEAILGIIAEGNEIMMEFAGTMTLDAGLVSAAQAVEHYEIARYGTLKTWARQLGLDEVVTLLDQTLAEEEATDEKLTAFATADANKKAS